MPRVSWVDGSVCSSSPPSCSWRPRSRSAQSSGAEQRIAVQPAVQDVAPGGIATLTLVYDANDSTLAGVALRLHYDSSKLTLDGARLLYSFATMGHQDQPDAGSDYADQYDDGDPATDRRYLAAWSDLNARMAGGRRRAATAPARAAVPRERKASTSPPCRDREQPVAVAASWRSRPRSKRSGAGWRRTLQPTPSAPSATTTPTPVTRDPGSPADDELVPNGVPPRRTGSRRCRSWASSSSAPCWPPAPSYS